jgi:hypothetical protein
LVCCHEIFVETQKAEILKNTCYLIKGGEGKRYHFTGLASALGIVVIKMPRFGEIIHQSSLRTLQPNLQVNRFFRLTATNIAP